MTRILTPLFLIAWLIGLPTLSAAQTDEVSTSDVAEAAEEAKEEVGAALEAESQNADRQEQAEASSGNAESAEAADNLEPAAVEAELNNAEDQAEKANADADEAAGDNADNAENAPEIELVVKPSSIDFSRSVQFDENGEIRSESKNLSIRLDCRYKSEGPVMGYQFRSVDPIETTDGLILQPEVYNHMQSIHHRLGQRREPSFSLSFSIQNAPEVRGSLKKIVGEVDLQVAIGPLKKATLGPLKEVDGKRARLIGIDNAWVQTTRKTDAVRVEMSENLSDRLDDIRLLTGNGIEIEPRGWSGGSGGSTFYREFRDIELPDDGRVELLIWEGTSLVTVPFELQDVPMPGQQDDDEFDLAIRAVPADGEAGDGEDQLGQIELEIDGANDG